MRFAKLLNKIVEIEEKIEELISDKDTLLIQLENIKNNDNVLDPVEEILQEEKYNNTIEDIRKISKEIERLYRLKIEKIRSSYNFYQNLFKSNSEVN